MKFSFPYSLSLISLFLICSCTDHIEQKRNNKATVSAEKKMINSEQDNQHPLFVSIDYGFSWEALGEGFPEGTQISFINKLENKLIIGSEAHGLFISENNKNHFVQIGKELPGKKINAIHVANEKIYIGVFRKGIFLSENKGETWSSINYNLPDLRVQAILKIKDKLLIATDSGIFKSMDGSNQWVQVFSGNQVVSLNLSKNIIVAGTTAGIILSINEGEDWDWIHREGAIHNTAILNGIIIAMYISNDLYVSSDWGENWSLMEYSPKINSYVYESAHIDNLLIMSNNYGVHQSIDQGKTWSLIYPMQKGIFFDFLVDDKIIYAGMRW